MYINMLTYEMRTNEIYAGKMFINEMSIDETLSMECL